MTVFRERSTGKTFLAVRGTEFNAPDLTTDIVDIGILGTTAFMAQYAGLKAKVQEWLGNGTLQSGFVAAGHSLGGFLVSALSPDFGSNISQVLTFNAPGVGGLTATVLRQFPGLGPIFRLIGALSRPNVTNLFADHSPSPVSSFGVQLGRRIQVHIENQLSTDDPNRPAVRNHSIRALADALALYDAMTANRGRTNAML